MRHMLHHCARRIRCSKTRVAQENDLSIFFYDLLYHSLTLDNRPSVAAFASYNAG
jgi:hypothetical protein